MPSFQYHSSINTKNAHKNIPTPIKVQNAPVGKLNLQEKHGIV